MMSRGHDAEPPSGAGRAEGAAARWSGLPVVFDWEAGRFRWSGTPEDIKAIAERLRASVAAGIPRAAVIKESWTVRTAAGALHGDSVDALRHECTTRRHEIQAFELRVQAARRNERDDIRYFPSRRWQAPANDAYVEVTRVPVAAEMAFSESNGVSLKVWANRWPAGPAYPRRAPSEPPKSGAVLRSDQAAAIPDLAMAAAARDPRWAAALEVLQQTNGRGHDATTGCRFSGTRCNCERRFTYDDEPSWRSRQHNARDKPWRVNPSGHRVRSQGDARRRREHLVELHRAPPAHAVRASPASRQSPSAVECSATASLTAIAGGTR